MRLHMMIVLLLFVSLFGVYRFILNPGFFSMHDDTQVARVVEMGRALRGGQFPVRWVSKLGYGYGYPIFNFYGPLPYYIGGFFYALGVDGLLSTKVVFLIAIFGAALTMYWLASELFGKAGGVLSASLYSLAPYHAIQLYIRGAVGESWIMIFLPLVTLGSLYITVYKKKNAGIIVSAVGLAGVILSHTILGYVIALSFAIVILFFWIVELFKKIQHSDSLNLLMSLCIGLGLSSFFWLPAISEMNATNVAGQIGPTANFKDHFICLTQLWDSAWGFGGSAAGCIDGLSFRIGKIHLIVSALSCVWAFWKRKRLGRVFPIVVVFLALSLLSTFFTLQVSEHVWELIPLFKFIQYPWRFLTFIIFGISLMAGASVLIFNNRLAKNIFVCIVVLGSLFFYTKLFSPQYLYQKSASQFETDNEIQWRASKISDEYLPKEIIRPQDLNSVPKIIATSDKDIFMDTETDTQTYSKLIIINSKDTSITLQRAYFPGWTYILDGQKVKPIIQSGLPIIQVPSGQHTFEFKFMNTWVRTLGNVVSVLTIFYLLFRYGKKNIA